MITLLVSAQDVVAMNVPTAQRMNRDGAVARLVRRRPSKALSSG
ncbi:hypothetical protein [Haloechinothrix salitolerans]|uniref:Uncharacterized protein n=1 Tax=Haloechinothrix salitolerans TaxID=926830 RepID=A0ABW2BXS9_9PSEU